MKNCITLLIILFTISTDTFSQAFCNAEVKGVNNWSTLKGWQCYQAVAPNSDHGVFNGDISISGLGTGEKLTINISLTINGNLTIEANGSNPTIELPVGKTLVINGNLINDNNNLTYIIDGVLELNGNLVAKNDNLFNVIGTLAVEDSLKVKNGTHFTGNGTIQGGTLFLGNNTDCGEPGSEDDDDDDDDDENPLVVDLDLCPVLQFLNCKSEDNFCDLLIPLPVQLINFSAETLKDQVTLNWSTAHEVNFLYFLVERSSDAKHFEVIGTVQEKGSTGITQYNYVDMEPGEGKVYYRLKGVDKDGTETVYKTISVESLFRKEYFSVYPNPLTKSSKILKVDYKASNNYFPVMSILDARGVEVYGTQLMSSKNQFMLTNLIAGVYTIVLKEETGLKHSMLIIE